MEIRGSSSLERINLDTTNRRNERSGQSPACSDSIQTSDQALLLSRNAAALEHRPDPRPEVLEKFAHIAQTDVDLDDATIDQILARM